MGMQSRSSHPEQDSESAPCCNATMDHNYLPGDNFQFFLCFPVFERQDDGSKGRNKNDLWDGNKLVRGSLFRPTNKMTNEHKWSQKKKSEPRLNALLPLESMAHVGLSWVAAWLFLSGFQPYQDCTGVFLFHPAQVSKLLNISSTNVDLPCLNCTNRGLTMSQVPEETANNVLTDNMDLLLKKQVKLPLGSMLVQIR